MFSKMRATKSTGTYLEQIEKLMEPVRREHIRVFDAVLRGEEYTKEK